jgi:dGTPase
MARFGCRRDWSQPSVLIILRYRRFYEEITFDLRAPAQIDRDRVLNSPHFSRLAEVTQLRSSSGDFSVHNRLTHSLKVAQVARRMAQGLQTNQRNLASTLGLNSDVAEAAGLAHDWGHPPFGHIAEEKLNELVSDANEGYEGNAQSFRIVTALSVSDAAPTAGTEDDFVAGLNLTSATLNAILKYPWSYKGNPEKLNKLGWLYN